MRKAEPRNYAAARRAQHAAAHDLPGEVRNPNPELEGETSATISAVAVHGEAELAAADRARPPVIGPGHTFGVGHRQDQRDRPRHARRRVVVPRRSASPSSLVQLLLLDDRPSSWSKGVGIWGINIPVGWGFAIINFVWWIGIGHAGTLISAILLLLHQKWRTSINRFAEAMTLFAVACAGIFPLLHTGRPWLAVTGSSRTRTRWASGRSSAAR